MHVIRGLSLSVALLLLSTAVMGEEIYRTVDDEGNVTYTDQPPTGKQKAEKVELPPGPSPESIQESQERNREIDKAANEAERRRQSQEQARDSQLEQARKALQEAEAKLAASKEIKDEDRQNLAGGKRRIRPEYFDRVKAAEAAVEKARKALREVRGY